MRRVVGAILCIVAAACSNEGTEVAVFTLYRSVSSDEMFRVHVATFDATGSNQKGSDFYNWSNAKNCERTATMFQAQPEWRGVKFWCEKGRFTE